MPAQSRLMILVLSAWIALAGAPRAAVGQNPNLLLPPLEPLWTKLVGVKPWETASSSPFGGSRWGGSDRRQFALSPDGNLLATEDAGGWQIEVWDVQSGKSLGKFGQIDDPVALAFSPDGSRLLTAGHDSHRSSAVEVWDLRTRRRHRGLDEDVNGTPFHAAAWSPDGKEVALGGGASRYTREPAIVLWDAEAGEELLKFEAPPLPQDAPWRSAYYECLCFSPDGRTVAGVRDQRIILWEVRTGKERAALGALPPVYATGAETDNSAGGIAFSRDGRTIAVGCADRLIRLWDVQSGSEMPPLSGHKDSLRAVVFSGETLLSFGKDNQVLAWPAPALRRPWPNVPERVTAPDVRVLWGHLHGEDRMALAHAIRLLGFLPAESLPLVREHVKPVKRVDSERIAKLVADIHKEDFNERKKAARELREFGDLALPALRKGRERGHDEIVERVHQRLQANFPTREQIHALNALRVLEVMGSDEARKHLELIAAGADESLLTREAKLALERMKSASPAALEQEKPEVLWAALAEDDARKAYRAMLVLGRQPKNSISLLCDKLRPLAAQELLDDDPRRVAQLIADLDAKAFPARQKAVKELERLGKRAEPMIRKATEAAPVLEVRKRLEGILQNLAGPKVSLERLQAERALEVLERIGGGEVQRALGDLAEKAKNRWMKDTIAGALGRIKGNPLNHAPAPRSP